MTSLEYTCRCPHATYSPRVHERANAAFGRRTFILGALASAAALCFARPASAADAAPDAVTLVRAARLFDGERMHTPGVAVLRGDRIVSLMAGDAGASPTTLDLGDVTLMPGLIDSHTHVSAWLVDSSYLPAFLTKNETSDSVAGAALLSIGNAQAMLRNGFTTVRDVGGGAGIDLAMRDAIARGVIVGPRMLTAGTLLSVTGGHADANDRPDWVHVDTDEQSGVAYGPYGFREQVREHVKRHVDLIKITATGGVLSYGDVFDVPQFNLDEIQAVVDEAHKFSRKVSAHAHGDRGISEAVMGGCDSIEHATGVGDKTLGAMQQRGTHLVPTIWALDSILQPGNPNKIPAGSIEKAHQAALLRNEGMKRALATSVKMAYGTDAGVFPHKENNKDFALLQSLGMHPLDILKSTTTVAAGLLGTPDRGRIAPGMLADLVAFSGDPSTNAGVLEAKPAMVMLGGKQVTV
jgi:imidazolonepropionase-like amidohydrolase